MLVLGFICLLTALATGQSEQTPEQLLDQAWMEQSQVKKPAWKLRQQIALQFERAGLHDKAMSVLDHVPKDAQEEQQASRAKGLHRLIRFHLKSHHPDEAMRLFELMNGNPPNLAPSAGSTYPAPALLGMEGKIDKVSTEKVAAVWSIALAEPKSPEKTKHALSIISSLQPAAYRDKIRYQRLSHLVSRLKQLKDEERDTIETKRLIAGIHKWLGDFETLPLIQLRRFAKTLADYGKVDPVVSLAEQLMRQKPEDNHYRFVASDLLLAAASVEHQNGAPEKSAPLVRRARELFDAVPDEVRTYWRGDLSFAMGLAKSGHQEEAIKLSSDDSMPGYMTDVCATIYHPGHPMVWILNQQLSKRQFKDASKLADRFSQTVDQQRAKAMIAKATAESGETKLATDILAQLEKELAEKHPKAADSAWFHATIPLELTGPMSSTYSILAAASGELADRKDRPFVTLSSERQQLIRNGELDTVLKALDKKTVTSLEVLDFAKTGHPAIALSLMDRLKPEKWMESRTRVLARIAGAAIRKHDLETLEQALAAADSKYQRTLRKTLCSVCVGLECQPALEFLLDAKGPEPITATASNYQSVEDYDRAFELATQTKQLNYIAHWLLYGRKYDAAIRFVTAAPDDLARTRVLQSLCRELAEQDRASDAIALTAVEGADKPLLQTETAAGLLDAQSIPKLWRGLGRWGKNGEDSYSWTMDMSLLSVP